MNHANTATHPAGIRQTVIPAARFARARPAGVMPQDRTRARMLDIARGKYKPKAGEPRIWFASMRSLAEVLSDENRALLRFDQS